MLKALWFGAALLLAGCQSHGVQTIPAAKGAAYLAGWVYYWGDGAGRLRLGGGGPERISTERFEAGGCLADVNRDGTADLVLQTDGRLVWYAGPLMAEPQTIDTEAGFSDCLGVELLGHRGLLVAHRGLQVRFYEQPREGAGRWPYREIYSFYTPSYQAGLLVRDVDGDGFPDILCGNYWIRSPESFEMPWRLHAINTYNETEDAAHVQLGMFGDGELLVVQGERKPAKVALFVAPGDRRQLWREQRLEGELDLDHPTSLAVGASGFATGEASGRGRLMWWQAGHDGVWKAMILGEGAGVTGLLLTETGRELIVVRRNRVERHAVPLQLRE